MEAGDFDNTPAPSGRPSVSLLRSDEDEPSAPSISSTTRTAGVRHHLLKTSTSGPTIVDRDLPVPPVLCPPPAASDTLAPLPSQTPELENKAPVPPRHSSTLSGASSPDMEHGARAMSPVNPLSDRALANAPHKADASRHRIDFQGEPNSTDFDGAGHPTARPHHRPSSTQTAPPSPSPISTMGAGDARRRDIESSVHHQALDAGASAPRYDGHSRSSKVRPAFQYYPTRNPVISGEGHGLDYRPPRNKVSPFDPRLERRSNSGPDEIKFVSDSSTVVSLGDTRSDHLGDSSAPGPRANLAATDKAYGRLPKVQVAVDSPDVAFFGGQDRPPTACSLPSSYEFQFPVSKIRPFICSQSHDDQAPPYRAYVPKAQPMVDFEIPETPSQTDSALDSGFPPAEHEALHVPVAKVKPFLASPSRTVDPDEGHHHLPKAQAITDRQSPSAFPQQSALDQCQTCNVPNGLDEHGLVERSRASPARPANDDPLDQPRGKHSISRCEEYPTYAGVESHTLDVCHRLLEQPGHSRQGINESHTPEKTPHPSRTGMEHCPSPVPLLSLRDSSPNLDRQGPADEESDAETPTQMLQDDRFTTTIVHGCPPSRRQSQPVERFERPKPSQPVQEIIHAPIPISKIRPFFQERVSSEQEGHSSVPKVKAAEDGTPAASARSEQYFDVECDKQQHPGLDNAQGARTWNGSWGRSQSLSSVLDYKRTAKWFREVLKHRDAYTTKFTGRPDRDKDSKPKSPEQRRNSESTGILSSRHLLGKSAQSAQSGSKFDGYGFKGAVGDLERLLNEALAIASQVVDRSETPSHRRYKPPSISRHCHRHSLQSGSDEDGGSRVNLTSSSAQENADSVEEMELGEAARPRRPTYRHAATYSGLQRRPRLHEIVQSCSGVGDEIKAREFVGREDQPREAPGPKVSFEVPHRKASKRVERRVAGRTIRRGPALSEEDAQWRARHDDAPTRTREIVVQLSTEKRSRYDHGGTARTSGTAGQHAVHGAHGEGGESGEELPDRDIAGRPMHADHGISLRQRSHISLKGASGFNLAKSRRRQPTARDWSLIRKRFVATVACISTALIGIILGIYAGLVPSIQYYIIDQSHATVHGNTGCFLGLAVPTFFLWPLPLLHGRKPYILSSLVLAMPLLFPQALAVNSQRLTNTLSWRAMLLAARTLMGGCLGFASMNFHSILTDLFGASLMSVNPHQEVVDQYDARRHGGGMGVWLGIWTWCWIGSLGVGFLVGACVIDNYPPAWGFYISIIIIAAVLFHNVVCPEVRQPGFMVMTVYSAWIYAQVVLIIVLLGSLTSRFYRLRSPEVGLLVGSVALGAFLAIPFQKANLFSRSRQAQMNSNLATLNRKVAWSSHLVRRTIFTLLLPLAGVCYAAVSSGPPMHVSVPAIFATCVGFLSCLAISECNGLVMETFDCSDLSPGMTGRQRGGSGKNQKRTNYSSFPRVTAGFAAIHGLAFVLAAAATALGGGVTRTLGQQVSTGVVAGILLLLTLMLLLVLMRFTEVQIIPQCKSAEMDKLVEQRRRSTIRRTSMPDDPQAVMEEERAWRPAMIGNPTGKKRRMNILELGGLSRWQEIRKKNRLIDEGSRLNRAALDQSTEALEDQTSDVQIDARDLFRMGGVRKKGSRRQRLTDEGSETADESVEMDVIDFQGGEAGPSGQGRFVERECVMSQTVEEESGEDEVCEARRRQRR